MADFKLVQRQTPPKEFLQDLLDHFDERYPGVESILVCIQSRPLKEDRNMCKYGTPSNGLTDQEKLWLLEIAKLAVLQE